MRQETDKSYQYIHIIQEEVQFSNSDALFSRLAQFGLKSRNAVVCQEIRTMTIYCKLYFIVFHSGKHGVKQCEFFKTSELFSYLPLRVALSVFHSHFLMRLKLLSLKQAKTLQSKILRRKIGPCGLHRWRSPSWRAADTVPTAALLHTGSSSAPPNSQHLHLRTASGF